MDSRLQTDALVRCGPRLFEIVSTNASTGTVELENCLTGYRLTLPVADVVSRAWVLVRSAPAVA
jgi:hypothetical protein